MTTTALAKFPWLLLLLLLISGRLSAQIAQHYSAEAMASSGPFDPSQIGGMMFRWRASDLTASNSVTKWADEIIPSTLVVNAGSFTNIIHDLRFPGGNGGQGLNATNVNMNAGASGAPCTNTIFVVFWPDGGAQAQLFDGTADATGYALHSNNHIFNEASALDLTKQAISVGQYQDWIQASTSATLPTIVGACGTLTVTNGVIAATNVVNGLSALAKVGTQHNGFSGYKGWISEIIIWTNIVLTTSQFTQLHTYRTTTYTSQH
jgi:hypothetical protein